MAVESRNFTLIRLLLQHGADIKSKNHDGVNPLHTVVLLQRDIFLSQWLIEYDLKTKQLMPCELIDFLDNIEAIGPFLVKHGIITMKDGCDNTPLMRAIYLYSNITTVKFLLDHGANINEQNTHGDTPLHQICFLPHRSNNRRDIMQILLRYGADATIKNCDGQLPIDLAKKYKLDTSIITLLEEAAGKKKD